MSKIEAAITGWEQRERKELEPRESSCFPERETLLRPLDALLTTLIIRLSKSQMLSLSFFRFFFHHVETMSCLCLSQEYSIQKK